MARAQPTLLDLAVALAAGRAEAYALARREIHTGDDGLFVADVPLSTTQTVPSFPPPPVVALATVAFAPA